MGTLVHSSWGSPRDLLQVIRLTCSYSEFLLNLHSLGDIPYMRCCRRHRRMEETGCWCILAHYAFVLHGDKHNKCKKLCVAF